MWCLKFPLGRLFLELFFYVQDLAGLVSAHWTVNGWNIKVPYADHEVQGNQMEELIQLMSHALLPFRGSMDRSTWEWDPKQTFLLEMPTLD